MYPCLRKIPGHGKNNWANEGLHTFQVASVEPL
jgi:hypothetical protein